MEETIDLEIQEVPTSEPESLYNFGITGLIDSESVKNFLDKTAENEPDQERQAQLLAEEIEYWRDREGFPVSEIDTAFAPFTPESTAEYIKWDKEQAKKIIGQYNSLKQMADILPTKEAEVIEPEISQVEEVEKIDMAAEMASEPEKSNFEMSREFFPPTPEKLANRTDAERYSDLVMKAEAKAREYEQRPTLTPVETKRLEEIRADIAYFSEKMKAAIAAEQAKAPVAPVAKIAAVREELSDILGQNAKKDSGSANIIDIYPDTPIISKEAPLITAKKPSLWSRLLGGTQDTEPANIEEMPSVESKADSFLKTKPPLRKVDGINNGIRIG